MERPFFKAFCLYHYFEILAAIIVKGFKTNAMIRTVLIAVLNYCCDKKEHEESDIQNQFLETELVSLYIQTIHLFGARSDDPAKGEDSFFALGISKTDATNFGKKYAQNAIIFSSSDATPRLILLVEWFVF